MKFDRDLCGNCDINSTLGSVVPLAMFIVLICRCNIFASLKLLSKSIGRFFFIPKLWKSDGARYIFYALGTGDARYQNGWIFRKGGNFGNFSENSSVLIASPVPYENIYFVWMVVNLLCVCPPRSLLSLSEIIFSYSFNSWYLSYTSCFKKILFQFLVYVYIHPAAVRRFFKNIAIQIEYVHT